jgi:hypothetical protein
LRQAAAVVAFGLAGARHASTAARTHSLRSSGSPAWRRAGEPGRSTGRANVARQDPEAATTWRPRSSPAVSRPSVGSRPRTCANGQTLNTARVGIPTDLSRIAAAHRRRR